MILACRIRGEVDLSGVKIPDQRWGGRSGDLRNVYVLKFLAGEDGAKDFSWDEGEGRVNSTEGPKEQMRRCMKK